MNVQLNPILARQRTAELQHAGEQARLTRGVSMSGRKLRLRNLITRLKARPARALGALIVPAMLAALVFGAPAAMGDPVGQISEFSVGPGTMPGPDTSAGADGKLWFTEPCARQEGSPEACQAQWTDWAGYSAPGCIPSTATRGSATATRSQVRQRRPTPRRPPTCATTRLPAHRQLLAPVFGHRDLHQCSDHRPVCPAPTPDAGALGAGHHAPDVHAYRAPGRGAVSAVEPLARARSCAWHDRDQRWRGR